MKIIDILNKMANGELEDGFKFAYEDVVYRYEKSAGVITNSRGVELGCIYVLEKCLNNEVLLLKESKVEPIEENKEIEEMKEISENLVVLNSTADDVRKIIIKINELVRTVNKINKEREEK